MENFKELSFEEIQKVEGGYWTTYYAQTSIGKLHLAVSDFCSSFVEGVMDGYDQAPKYEPKH